ncbi:MULTISPECIES: hypothetical protein [Legionella]|uniref:hypothetical protein n=1 Tax=Legionella TaxID=445 RepID=UPI0010411473|nr:MULTISPECIES: hypothetical protein [Legionella]
MEINITKTKISIILLNNAFEFAKRAAQDVINKEFKFAIINFCSAIEQIIKAKLVLNDWKCIVNRKTINYDDFLRGNFQSITIDKALQQLNDIPKKYSDIINELFQERNKVIHFFNHKLHSENNEEETVIANSIYHAWFYMHKYLSNNRDTLYFQPDFHRIHRELKTVKSYLEEVYKQSLNEVETEKQKGKRIISCDSCGLEAMSANSDNSLVKIGHCLICQHDMPFIEIECGCGTLNHLFEVWDCYCNNEQCEEKISLSTTDIQDALPSISYEFESGHEYGDCNLCDHCDTVGMIEDYYICSNCFEMSETINQCEHCGKLSIFLSSESLIVGCPSCDGIMSGFS